MKRAGPWLSFYSKPAETGTMLALTGTVPDMRSPSSFCYASGRRLSPSGPLWFDRSAKRPSRYHPRSLKLGQAIIGRDIFISQSRETARKRKSDIFRSIVNRQGGSPIAMMKAGGIGYLRRERDLLHSFLLHHNHSLLRISSKSFVFPLVFSFDLSISLQHSFHPGRGTLQGGLLLSLDSSYQQELDTLSRTKVIIIQSNIASHSTLP